MGRGRAASLSACVLLLWGAARGAFEASAPVPVSIAAAGSPADAGSAGGVGGNPAWMAGGSSWGAGAGWTRPMGLEGLASQAGWAFRAGPRWGAGLRWRGLSAGGIYREDALETCAATGFGTWSLGGTLAWERLDVAGIEGLAAGGRIGLLWRPTPDWTWALSAGNPSVWASEDWMALPAEAAFGLSFAEGEAWRGGVSVPWREGGRPDLAATQKVRFGRGWFSLGTGLRPWRLLSGAGFAWRRLRLEWAAEGDPTLGWQSHLGLAFGPSEAD